MHRYVSMLYTETLIRLISPSHSAAALTVQRCHDAGAPKVALSARALPRKQACMLCRLLHPIPNRRRSQKSSNIKGGVKDKLNKEGEEAVNAVTTDREKEGKEWTSMRERLQAVAAAGSDLSKVTDRDFRRCIEVARAGSWQAAALVLARCRRKYGMSSQACMASVVTQCMCWHPVATLSTLVHWVFVCTQSCMHTCVLAPEEIMGEWLCKDRSNLLWTRHAAWHTRRASTPSMHVALCSQHCAGRTAHPS